MTVNRCVRQEPRVTHTEPPRVGGTETGQIVRRRDQIHCTTLRHLARVRPDRLRTRHGTYDRILNRFCVIACHEAPALHHDSRESHDKVVK